MCDVFFFLPTEIFFNAPTQLKILTPGIWPTHTSIVSKWAAALGQLAEYLAQGHTWLSYWGTGIKIPLAFLRQTCSSSPCKPANRSCPLLCEFVDDWLKYTQIGFVNVWGKLCRYTMWNFPANPKVVSCMGNKWESSTREFHSGQHHPICWQQSNLLL